MKSGYKISWTDYALKELEQTITYLEENWTEKELRNLASKIEETLELLSQNPNLFQSSEIKKDIRRVVVLTYNTLYYRINGDTVEVISLDFFKSKKSKEKKIKIVITGYEGNFSRMIFVTLNIKFFIDKNSIAFNDAAHID